MSKEKSSMVKQYNRRAKALKGKLRFPLGCIYCKHPISGLEEHTFDHRVPLSRGGTNSEDNLVHCCTQCNSLKADLSEEEFIPLREALITARREKQTVKPPIFLKYTNRQNVITAP